MTNLRLLIVDDEPLIRLGLRTELSKFEAITIVSECDTGAAAIESILSQPLDLILLDVQLPDCTGLEVVRQIGPARMPMVIFVTAYDEYAVKAFELNAVDYLLKPFDEQRLSQSIERARARLSSRNQSDFQKQLQALLVSSGQQLGSSAHQQSPERLVVKNGEHYEFVPVDSIEWIESANNYVQLHCSTKTHLLGETLNAMEMKLDPAKFSRVHRRHIVNISRIIAIHPLLNGSYQLQMKTGAQVSTGRQYKTIVQNLLKT